MAKAREESLALCTAEGTAGRNPKLQSREKLLARCTGSLPKTGGGAKRKTFSSVPFGSVQAASSPPSIRIAKSSQTPAPREWPQRTRRFFDFDGLLPWLLLPSSSRRLRPSWSCGCKRSRSLRAVCRMPEWALPPAKSSASPTRSAKRSDSDCVPLTETISSRRWISSASRNRGHSGSLACAASSMSDTRMASGSHSATAAAMATRSSSSGWLRALELGGSAILLVPSESIFSVPSRSPRPPYTARAQRQ
mmetsp:Transcript_48894/g.116298  ORF Transcript_48894/g.116298 Transcript_48894/m.116298 type:complete len:250 (-) Transcript_48894:36-785(-)